MQIKIKTYDQISSERASIEVSPGQRIELVIGEQKTDPGTLGRLAGQEDRIADLEAQLEEKARELKKAENGSIANREWAERAETRADRLGEELTEARTTLSEIRRVVTGPAIEDAMTNEQLGGHGVRWVRLAKAIREVRAALK